MENTINAVNHLTRTIFTSLSDLKKSPIIANIIDDNIILDSSFMNYYLGDTFFKKLVDDLYNFNKKYCSDFYKQEGVETLKLFGLYNKLEAHKYANYNYSNVFQVSGSNFNIEGTEAISFITLDNNLSYNNELFPRQVVWLSKRDRSLHKNGQLTNEGKIANGTIKMKIFIKKGCIISSGG